MTLPVAPTHPERLVYLGTPAMAVPPLRALVAAGFDIAVVITRIDKRRGRGSKLTPSPVKAAAAELGLPVSHDLDEAATVGADLGVVVAYGRLIPTAVLEGVPMINIHFSLLPRWRGAAPVERAILAGDPTTGVCLMAVDEALDTGDVYARTEVPIGPDQALADLQAELVEVGSTMLVDELRRGLRTPVPQDGEPTYAAKIDPDELRLDFTRSADELHRIVRLGRAWCEFRDRRLKVLRTTVSAGPVGEWPPGALVDARVATGEGWLGLVEVQPEAKKPMSAEAWLNGAQPERGEPLG